MGAWSLRQWVPMGAPNSIDGDRNANRKTSGSGLIAIFRTEEAGQ